MEGEEKRPLQWPEGWPRTRFQDRKGMTAWKRSYADAAAALVKELRLSKVTSYLITRNDPDSQDAGVAVYLSLKPIDNYGWQEALGFIGEVPTTDQVTRAYMEKAKAIPRVNHEPDPELLMELTRHRDRARAWIRGEKNVEHEKVIACDVFKEQRWNMLSIRGTLYCMRMMERYGATTMTERAWRGFNKQITAGVASGSTAA